MLGESAVKAIKGDTDYALTYYKKTLDERMKDYRRAMPKLSVFGSNEDSLLKEREKLLEAVRDNATPEQIQKIHTIMGVSV